MVQSLLQFDEPKNKREIIEKFIRQRIKKYGICYNWDIEEYCVKNMFELNGKQVKIMANSGLRYARWLAEGDNSEIEHPGGGNPHCYVFRSVK